MAEIDLEALAAAKRISHVLLPLGKPQGRKRVTITVRHADIEALVARAHLMEGEGE